jgi:hypothetical protein
MISLAPTVRGDFMRDSGKYITIYRRQPGGTWQIARDIWNSDGPPPRYAVAATANPTGEAKRPGPA